MVAGPGRVIGVSANGASCENARTRGVLFKSRSYWRAAAASANRICTNVTRRRERVHAHVFRVYINSEKFYNKCTYSICTRTGFVPVNKKRSVGRSVGPEDVRGKNDKKKKCRYTPFALNARLRVIAIRTVAVVRRRINTCVYVCVRARARVVDDDWL